jgi:hypothetical protein
MMMRFLGGAVGHKGTRPENGTAWESYEVPGQGGAEDDEEVADLGEELVEDDEEIPLQTIAPSPDASENEDSDFDDTALGPEDGEDDESFVEQAGYDEL